MARDAALEAVFQPVRPPTTFEETVERLGTAIRLGLLAPGGKLPPERELATELRISRSTLREALTTLTERPSRRPARPHRRYVRRRGAALGGARGRAARPGCVVDPRAPCGGRDRATILACERAEAHDLDRLDEQVEKMAEAEDFEDYRRADIRFHIGVAEAARSPRLLSEMTEVQGAMSDLDRADRPPRTS